ncbi:MAG TPA: hypothetical protein VGX71_11525 [Pseudaminobacter sp.]|nr:hypothetical protein [Pseudaminobacter sp.]
MDSRILRFAQDGTTPWLSKTMVLALVLFPALAGFLGGEAAIVLAFG